MFRRNFSNHNLQRGRSQRGRGNRFGRQAVKSSISTSQYIKKADAPDIEAGFVIKHRFADFAINEQLKTNIASRGYTTPTPIQDQTIPYILTGRDVVGIANTGTGKTAAFLVPLINKIILNRSEKALIIVPTRELAVQVNDELKAFTRNLHISATLCIGGTNINQQISSLRINPNFLICTPGRLKDLLVRRVVDLKQFKSIVLDEVDRMVDIGFIRDIKYFISLLPHERQSLFFSATVPVEVQGIIQAFLKSPVTVSVKVKETAGQIEQDIIRVKDKSEKVARLTSLLRQEEFTKVLIFGRTKWSVERLSKTLQASGFSAGSIHGNKSQNQRIRALSQFKGNQLQVLVATDIAARGLDIDSVSHVINFDEPSSYTDYIHRIGRTGRADKQGKALTFLENG